ncbi:GDSL-type esterase/lipase family protein [Brevundimonas vesicularis]|uniref:SGNH/GDSL hydrolase family protein n=1 Tax=Brevundimonas vesicularis TaxID=41276 RepID=UPI003850D484
MKNRLAAALLCATLLDASGAFASTLTVSPTATAPGRGLPIHVGGRVQVLGTGAETTYRSQWPGVYFESAFHGRDVAFRTGPGDVRLRVTVDGQAVDVMRPAAGLHRIEGLSDGDHRLRIDVISENQSSPVDFGGVYGAPAQGLPIHARDRQIEFIGDSHTVGYANTSNQRICAPDQVWETTDTAAGIAGLMAQRYQADYQVNAISGRGVVRNYDGAPLDTLPQAYGFVLFDKKTPYADPEWRPQVVVVALGTNDFSTPVKPGEKWRDLAALTADYEASYATFLSAVAQRNPQARILVWGMAGSAMAGVASRVVDTLKASGLNQIAFVPVSGMELNACDWHPDLADDRAVAAALTAALGEDPAVWSR